MIDDIRLVETLPNGSGTVYGLAGTVIALPRIEAALRDTDGSEVLRIELLGLPTGAVVSDGTRSATIGAAGLVLDISAWNLAQLSLRPPSSFVGTLSLQVRATSTEVASGASASVSQDLTVHVLSGVAVDTPVGANPYVTLIAGAGGADAAPAATPTVAAGTLLPATGGTVQFSTSTAPVRTWEDEEAEDQARARTLSEQWLRELEAAAQAQWSAMVVTP
jgi:hypothetical protein